MIKIKSPISYEYQPNQRTLFLAGGISNCSDWQATISNYLSKADIVLLNPRRDDFDVTNPVMEHDQIEWEHQHILKSSSYLFWFCEETICPITLFELGKVIGMFPNKPIFVGTHPNYKRKRDVIIQMLLMRPEINVVHDLDQLVSQVSDWAKEPFHSLLEK